MIETFVTSMQEWNKKHSERAKMQHAYFTAIVMLVVVAGLVSLLNIEFGRRVLALAAVLGVVWLVNAVAWALLQSFVLNRLNTTKRVAARSTVVKK